MNVPDCASAHPADDDSRDLHVESDRFRDLSPSEQRLATMIRDGEDIVDRYGRLRAPLSSGPISRLVAATHPIQRRRSSPSSSLITQAEFLRAYSAVATANVKRLVLNTFLTVSWEVGGVRNAKSAQDLHGEFLKRMRAWVRYANTGKRFQTSFACVWVKEVGRHLGLHSHFLVHVPEGFFNAFRYWAAGTARRLLELPKPDPRLPAPSLRVTHTSSLGNVVDNQWTVFRYMMKGIDPDSIYVISAHHHRFLVTQFANLKPSEQGVVVGKRTGFSEGIGPKEQRIIEARLGPLDIEMDQTILGGLPFDNRYLHHGELLEQLMAC